MSAQNPLCDVVGIAVRLANGEFHPIIVHSTCDSALMELGIIHSDGSVTDLFVVPRPTCAKCNVAIKWEPRRKDMPKFCRAHRIEASVRNIKKAIAARTRPPKPEAPGILCPCGVTFKRGANDGGAKRCRPCRAADRAAHEARLQPTVVTCGCGTAFEQPPRRRGGRPKEQCPDCRKRGKVAARDKYAHSDKAKAATAIRRTASTVPRDWIEQQKRETAAPPTANPTSTPVPKGTEGLAHCDDCKRTVATHGTGNQTTCRTCGSKHITPIIGTTETIIDGQPAKVTKYADPGWADTDDKSLLPDWWHRLQ